MFHVQFFLENTKIMIKTLEKTEGTFMVKVRSKSGQMTANFERDIFASKWCSFDAARRVGGGEFNGGLRFPLSGLEQPKNQLWKFDVITLTHFFRHNYATKWAMKLKFDMPIVNNELYDIHSGFLKTLKNFNLKGLKSKILNFYDLGVKFPKTLKSEIAVLQLCLICIFFVLNILLYLQNCRRGCFSSKPFFRLKIAEHDVTLTPFAADLS